MHDIKIYSTPSCPYCHTLMAFLDERNIKYQHIDVSEDEKAKDEIIQKSGQMGLPIIDIDGEIIVGFDREKIVKKLNLKD